MIDILHLYTQRVCTSGAALCRALKKEPWAFWLGLVLALLFRWFGYHASFLSLVIFVAFFYLFRLAFLLTGFALSFVPLRSSSGSTEVPATPYATFAMYASMAYVIFSADILQINPWSAYIFAALFLLSFVLTQFILDGSSPGLPDGKLFDACTTVRQKTLTRYKGTGTPFNRTMSWRLLEAFRYIVIGLILPLLWFYWAWHDRDLWRQEHGWMYFLFQIAVPFFLWALFLVAQRFLLLGPYQRKPRQEDPERLALANKWRTEVEWFTWLVAGYIVFLCLLFVILDHDRSDLSLQSFAYLLYPISGVIILLYGLHTLHRYWRILYEETDTRSHPTLRRTARLFCFFLVPFFAAWIITSLIDSWQRWWGPSSVITRIADNGTIAGGKEPCQEVWLALSGGGYRAAAIHLGVLQGLEALKRLPDLVSSVSGGSIVGAYYAAGGETKLFENILENGNNFVSQLFPKQRDIPKLSLWDFMFHIFNVTKFVMPGISRTDIYVNFFEQTYFRGLKPADVQRAHLLVNTTDLSQQKRVVFYGLKDSDPDPTDSSVGSLYGGVRFNGSFDLAHAVAASGAFPGAFRPLTLKPAPQQELRLIDGGAVENLGLDGLETAWRDPNLADRIGCPAFLVISDASQESQHLGEDGSSISGVVLAANDVTWQANHERLLKSLLGPLQLPRYATDTPFVREVATKCLRGEKEGRTRVIFLDATSQKGRQLLGNAVQGKDGNGQPVKPQTDALCKDLKREAVSSSVNTLLAKVADIPTLKDLNPDEARIAIAVGKCTVGLFVDELMTPLASCIAGPHCPPVTPIKIILRGVNFDFDKSDITSDSAVILDEAARTLQQYPVVSVIVEGHTDAKGSDEYNQRLSERRADAVRNYLEAKDVIDSRFYLVGRGEQQPIAPNDTPDGKDNPEGRKVNRRVELRAYEYRGAEVPGKEIKAKANGETDTVAYTAIPKQ